MPPKRKNYPKNGFYFLMLEHKNKLANNDVYITMPKAAEQVKHIWENMDVNQRDYYNRMADKYRIENYMQKCNSDGIDYKTLEQQLNAKEEEKMGMDLMIKDTVSHLDQNTTLRTKEFHVIHINYFCIAGSEYIPAEIGLAKFCLQKGIVDKFHIFVDPAGLPRGYRFSAVEHSNRTHKIPVDWDEGERSMFKIFNEIKHFLKPDGNTGDFPPLYTMPDNLNTNANASCVKKVLSTLCENQGFESSLFKVYLLPKLFFELRNACNRDAFPTSSIAESELEKDVFNYTRNIACKFHEDQDAVEFCSLSTVQRWVFLICDHCCKDLDIGLVPGRHCPENADTNYQYKEVSSFSSSDRRDSERSRRSPPHVKQPSKPSSIRAVDDDDEELRQPFKSTLMKHWSSNDGAVGGTVSATAAPPTERPAPSSSWSSAVTERSRGRSSLPPLFDEDNYPAIGGGAGRGFGQPSNSRFNKWSGRGRGGRGRGIGLSSNFENLDLNK